MARHQAAESRAHLAALTSHPGPITSRDFPSMAAAMDAAGFPAACDWNLRAGCPDLIFTVPAAGRRPGPPGARDWRIQAPGVAHELIDAVCAADLSRAWSGMDLLIIDTVVSFFLDDALPLALDEAWRAGARIAGHYAAARQVTQGQIAAAVTAPGTSGASCSIAATASITAGIAGLLRAAGVTVYDDRPPDDMLRDLTGRLAARYQLRPARPGRPGGGEAAGCYGFLSEAMAAAGYPALESWRPDPADPGRLLLNRRGGAREAGWAIEAPGVARQYAGACPDHLRISRQWSAADARIRHAVLSAAGSAAAGRWRLPQAAAVRAAACLSAWYASGGLAAGSIFTVLAEAYGRVGMVPPPAVADGLTADIAGRLAIAGIAAGEYEPGPGGRLSPVLRAARARVTAAVRAAGGRAARAVLDEVYWRIRAPLTSLPAFWPASRGNARGAGRPARIIAAVTGRVPARLRRRLPSLAVPACAAAAVAVLFSWRWPPPAPAGHSWVFWALITAMGQPDILRFPAPRPEPRRQGRRR